MHAYIPKDNFFIKIKRNICIYNAPDQPGAQEECEVQKWEEGIIYVGSTCHIWVHRISSTVVQIIIKNNNGERFLTEYILQIRGK